MSTADTFVPELENMNLAALKDQMFCIGISTGDRDRVGFLPSTIHGPFDFCSMVEYVHQLWNSRLDHAKVLILSKVLKEDTKWLNAATIDYIIAKAPDILLEEVVLTTEDPFTCEAGIVAEPIKEKEDAKL